VVFWIALPLIEDLGESITLPLAVAVIGGIAIVPGYLNGQPDRRSPSPGYAQELFGARRRW